MTMTDSERLMALARLVRDMRAAQRHYFRTRTPEALESSKAKERALDREAESILLFTVPSIFDLEPAESA